MNAGERTVDVYDEVPYIGKAIPLSHPCQLAMVGRLCGLQPPSPTRCRVLELGCAVGTNLLPMAEGLPNSRFVGVDLSSGQIARAQELRKRAGLDNVELLHLDILDVDQRLGPFDYIICHGVYSWVGPDVQAHVLDIGSRLLTPTGLMYVSYNTQPGWHLRGVIRDMMQYHVANLSSAHEKIAQARELMRFLSESARPSRESYRTLLKEEMEATAKASDYYLFHEQLERVNTPVFFHQFVERAEASGLAYLADADIPTMFAQNFDDAMAEKLCQLPLIRREQYMDFLRGRIFRASILRRPECEPDKRMESSRLMTLHARIPVPLEPVGTSGEATIWAHADKHLTTAQDTTATLRRLREQWPGWVPVRDLVAPPVPGTPATPPAVGRVLDGLLALVAKGVIVVAEDPPPLAPRAGERPKCSPLVQAMAGRGDWVVNRYHESVQLDPLTRFLVRQLDGASSRRDLAAGMIRAIAQGDLQVAFGEQSVQGLDEAIAATLVEHRLDLLAHHALLVP